MRVSEPGRRRPSYDPVAGPAGPEDSGDAMTLLRGRAAVLAVVLGLSASGCWEQTGGTAANQYTNPFERTITPETVASLAPVWTAPGSADIVSGGHVVGADGSVVRSLSAGTGSQRWRVDYDNSGLPGITKSTRVAPTVVGDQVWAGLDAFVGTPNGGSCGSWNVAIDLATGTKVAPTLPGTPSAIVPFGDLVASYETTYVFSQQSFCVPQSLTGVTVTDVATGATVWTGAVGQRPVVIGDQLLNLQGTTLRSYAAAGCGTATCEPGWTTELPVPGATLAAADGRAYVLSWSRFAEGALLAIDLADGSVEWSATVGIGPASMSLAEGRVHLTAGSELATFDGAGCGSPRCTPLWTAELTGPGIGNVVSAGGVVYQGIDGGVVAAYDAAGCGGPTCAPIATLTVPGDPWKVIVSGGRLFVTAGLSSRTVTAFAPA